MRKGWTCTFAIAFAFLAQTLCAKESREQLADGRVKDSGLIIPLDDHGMYLRNPAGQVEVRFHAGTRVALQVNTRQFKNVRGDTLRYAIPSSDEVIEFSLPSQTITAIKHCQRVNDEITTAEKESWIVERGLELHFGKTFPDRMPTEKDPRFVGSYAFRDGPNSMTIGDKSYEVSMKKGGQTDALLFGLLQIKDVKPFVSSATVVGKQDGKVILADEIHVVPIGDPTHNDDPKLPRYLFIGDSISGNYSKGLRSTLAGKVNAHHPPTNCGPSRKGRSEIVAWLGAYDQPGRNWDVISFNFGHWDSGNTQANYQADLEFIIGHLKRTGAKLVFATTCPVPAGMPEAGDLVGQKAPGRKNGVMRKYINPWALEVIQRHPEISVCDQWQFVKDHENDHYSEWWKGDNVHFSGKQADELGKLLGQHILQRL